MDRRSRQGHALLKRDSALAEAGVESLGCKKSPLHNLQYVRSDSGCRGPTRNGTNTQPFSDDSCLAYLPGTPTSNDQAQ